MGEQEQAAASHLRVDTAAGLSRIHEPHLNLCYWRRTCSAELAASLDVLARTHEFHQVRNSWRDQISATELVALTGDLPDSMQTAWACDIEQLLHVFCQIAGTQRVLLKLASTTRTDCPVFHTDYVPLRLLCTYTGSGTEFVDDRNVQRSSLGRTQGRTAQEVNQDILLDPHNVEHLLPFDVALCKGEVYPDGRGHGLVHRSPRITPASPPRIKLTIDVVGM